MLAPLEQLVFAWVLGFVILVGCFAYVVVVWVVYMDKEFRRTSASVFLLNLLTIDVLNLLLVMPFSINSVNGRWDLSEGWKLAVAFLGTWFDASSVLALAVISLDRFMAVRRPFIYIAAMTKQRAVVIVLFTWFQSLVFSIVPIPLKWYSFNVRYVTCTLDVNNTTTSFRVFMLFFVVCNFLLSLIVVVGTYLYIFKVARYHRKSIAKSIFAVARLPCIFFKDNNKLQAHATRRKAIKSAVKMSVVIGAFVVCHTPYAVVRLLNVLRREDMVGVSESVTVTTKWLSYIKSALDPFIYFIVQHRFRRHFHKLLSALIHRRNRVGVQPPASPSRRTTRITALGSVEDVSADLSRRTTLEQNTSCKHVPCKTLLKGSQIHTDILLPVAVVVRDPCAT